MNGKTILLFKFARFIRKENITEIEREIKIRIKGLGDIQRDSWLLKNRILIETSKENINQVIDKLIDLTGIVSVTTIDSTNFNIEITSLSQFIKFLVDFFYAYDLKKCSLEFNQINSLPFHRKAVIDRLDKKKIEITKKSKKIVYIEGKKIKSKNYLRIGMKRNYHQTDAKPKKLVTLVLYSPFTKQEISDFCRLSMVFKTKIIFTNENKLVPSLIEKTSKSLFKGIDKISYQIIPSLNEYCNNVKISENLIGFSLWAHKHAKDLKEYVDNLNENNKQNFSFIFGNEETGLPYDTHLLVTMFKLGFWSSEPLRATQAAAYALGLLDNIIN